MHAGLDVAVEETGVESGLAGLAGRVDDVGWRGVCKTLMGWCVFIYQGLTR